jgi:hypothetical protein
VQRVCVCAVMHLICPRVLEMQRPYSAASAYRARKEAGQGCVCCAEGAPGPGTFAWRGAAAAPRPALRPTRQRRTRRPPVAAGARAAAPGRPRAQRAGRAAPPGGGSAPAWRPRARLGRRAAAAQALGTAWRPDAPPPPGAWPARLPATHTGRLSYAGAQARSAWLRAQLEAPTRCSVTLQSAPSLTLYLCCGPAEPGRQRLAARPACSARRPAWLPAAWPSCGSLARPPSPFPPAAASVAAQAHASGG